MDCDTSQPTAENDYWYLWVDLARGDTEEHNYRFSEDYCTLNDIMLFKTKYEHLQIHGGELIECSPIINCTLLYRRYEMAKTCEQFKSELDDLKSDLIKHFLDEKKRGFTKQTIQSLEARIIGPTNDPEMIRKYGDNFELQKSTRKFLLRVGGWLS